MTFVNIKIGDNGRFDSYLSIKFIETKFSQDKYLILAKYIYDEDGFIRAYWDLSFLCTSSDYSKILKCLIQFSFYIIKTDECINSKHQTFIDPETDLPISAQTYKTSVLNKLIDDLNIEFIKKENLKFPDCSNFFSLHPFYQSFEHTIKLPELIGSRFVF
jgi:hypothetical protein